jgi:type I restriction enzyme S subunit
MAEYESYQSTSYRWLPKVPSHWLKKSIRQITSVLSERCGDRDYRLLSVYREYGVIPKDSRDDNHNKESLNLSNYKVVHIGDLVLNKMKMWQGSLGVSQYEGIVSPAYIICKVLDKDINLDYLHLLLRSARFKSYYNQYSYGIRVGQWDMHYEDFKNLKVYMPPRAEQDQIVRFLDWKVSEINKLIGIRRKEIQELEGLKKVIVHKAITGKNCDTEIRDTSIEWIGAIPAEWEIRHVKNVAIITNGSDPKTEGNIPVYGSGDGSFKTCGEYKEGPAVLIGRKGTIHIPHYVEGKYWNVDTAFDVHMKDDNDLRWFYYLAQCFDYQFYISQTTLPSMTQTDYNNMPIPVPSVPVQHEIASYLDRENLKIDKAIDLTEQKIDALAEMKNTLISDAVTGKIDVRNITVPEYEHVDDIVDDDLENNEETETDGEEA